MFVSSGFACFQPIHFILRRACLIIVTSSQIQPQPRSEQKIDRMTVRIGYDVHVDQSPLMIGTTGAV
jgi:hypothetical protein